MSETDLAAACLLGEAKFYDPASDEPNEVTQARALAAAYDRWKEAGDRIREAMEQRREARIRLNTALRHAHRDSSREPLQFALEQWNW